ncbi:MAG: hypothetical protein RLZZ623_2047 [Actinomycetota bacterium]|jgi:peptidoglycan LD-endopeptidase LytH
MNRSRVSRRTALVVAGTALVVGFGSFTPDTGAAPLPTAAVELPIEQAATVTRPAKRLRQMGSMLFPMQPTPRCAILDNFGDPRSGGRTHEGIDILATLGQEIYAVADGTLTTQTDATATLSGNSWGLTASVDGAYYFYGHLSAFAAGLTKGSTVQRGQVIGYVGDTGNAGPGNYHLHFGVFPGGQKGVAVNPLPLLEVPKLCTIT